MFEISHRPFQEIRFTRDETNTSQLDEIVNWVSYNAQYIETKEQQEYIIALPHPSHPSLGGLSFDSFTENCPPLLKEILSEIYEARLKQMLDEKWTSDFDLENDFGFVLIAFL